MNTRKVLPWISLLVMASIILSACGGSKAPAPVVVTVIAQTPEPIVVVRALYAPTAEPTHDYTQDIVNAVENAKTELAKEIEYLQVDVKLLQDQKDGLVADNQAMKDLNASQATEIQALNEKVATLDGSIQDIKIWGLNIGQMTDTANKFDIIADNAGWTLALAPCGSGINLTVGLNPLGGQCIQGRGFDGPSDSNWNTGYVLVYVGYESYASYGLLEYRHTAFVLVSVGKENGLKLYNSMDPWGDLAQMTGMSIQQKVWDDPKAGTYVFPLQIWPLSQEEYNKLKEHTPIFTK